MSLNIKKSLAAVRLFSVFAIALLILAAAGMPARAAERTGAIVSCLISGDHVVCATSFSQVPASDDGMVYVFADEVWQDGCTGQIVGQGAIGQGQIAFPLNFNTPSSNLSRKFILAVKQGGRFVQVSDEHYITNPEAFSTYAAPRRDHGIKGILPDPARLAYEELLDLGVQQAAYNISLGDIVGESSNPAVFPTTYYSYDGAVYAFDTYRLSSYDNVIKNFSDRGIQVTINILNNMSPKGMDLIHPLARDGKVCPNYAFNTADAAGTNHLKAIAAFLGQRYSGLQGFGQVDNWIVGNEINARTEQYYLASDSIELNVSEYHKAFRIFYNGIRSVNATAMIYNSIDQEWGRKSNPGSFLSREYLDRFNYYVNREGNIDWGLSFHPYNSPLYDPYTWLGYDVWVHKDFLTPYITMQNLYLLTDYMHQPQFLNPYGDVRSISISEIGFTSSFGDQLQCASIVYGYLQAKANPDIDSFILYRQTDHADEIKSNIAQGLVSVAGTHKPAYDFYKYIDTPSAGPYIQQASAIIGQDVNSLIGIRDFQVRGGWTD